MIGSGQPAFTWTRESISQNAPAASGVYCIFNARVWIYVGESQDIRARLLAHFDADIACITRNQPGGFQFEFVGAQQRVARQDQLILALRPACNQKLG